MAKLTRDSSFEREGRSIGEWLGALVGDDAKTRVAAGEALQSMMHGIPSVHTPLGEFEWGSHEEIIRHSERFNEVVRSAVMSPELIAQEFVRKLILYRMALRDDWQRRMAVASEEADAENAYLDRLVARLQAAGDDTERAAAARRCMRWFCASMARSLTGVRNAFSGAEATAAPGVMAALAFKALDVALLADRPGLHAMLEDKDLRRDAALALARIGPPAVDFAAVLFEQLDAGQFTHFHAGAQALGSIGRDDTGVIDGLLRRLSSGRVVVCSGAALTLFHAGPPLAGRLDVGIELLIEATHRPGAACAAIRALASAGRDSEGAFRRVLQAVEPRPPRWESSENFPDYKYDEVMIERGAAIDSLHYFTRHADQAVAALVEALDSFEEFDPDWGYEGELGRICTALAHFGPVAAPGVPRLLRFLSEWRKRPADEREWPKDVFGLLAAIGPLAAEALPVLDQIRAMQRDDRESAAVDLDSNEPLDRAIIAIRGRTGRAS